MTRTRLFAATAAVAILAASPAPAATITGTFEANHLLGTTGKDLIQGGGGDDVIYGDPVSAVGAPVKIERLLANGKEPSLGVQDFDVSADGRWVLFTSPSPEFLPPGEGNNVAQAYLMDRKSGEITHLSKRNDGGPVNKPISQIAISPDGSVAGFVISVEADLPIQNKPNGIQYMVVLEDLKTKNLEIVSRSFDGSDLSGDYNVERLTFSPNGSFFAFSGTGKKLVPNDTNSNSDIFIVKIDDLSSIFRASTKSNGSEAFNGHSTGPCFSPDSKSIIFVSGADNLMDVASEDKNGAELDVFAKVLTEFDVATSAVIGTVSLLSIDINGKADDSGYSSSPVFSPDGLEVAFTSTADALVTADTNNTSDVFIKTVANGGSRPKGTVRIASRSASGVQGNGSVDRPIYSPDGAKILFLTNSSNLNEQNLGGFYQLFIKDLSVAQEKGSTAIVSINLAGTVANSFNVGSKFVGHGRQVAFMSVASNLVASDNNNSPDLFFVTLPPGPGGDDTLDGGTGADVMIGSAGNDTYKVDNVGDRPFEYPGDGTDTVVASVPFTLPDNVENLVLAGSAATGKGNELANVLTGNGAVNQLYGLGGNDRLDGKGGADRMEGGAGNDTYVVDNRGDRVIEAAGKGTDTVRSSIDYVLPANTEKLVLTGAAKLGTGNGAANTILGNARANRLEGKAGPDRLTGGAGRDVFVYRKASDSPAGNKKRDSITDFDPRGRELIDLSRVDGNSRKPGRQHFAWRGSKRFSGKPGQLRFARGLLQGDVDGDRRADFEIKITVKHGRGSFAKRNVKLR